MCIRDRGTADVIFRNVEVKVYHLVTHQHILFPSHKCISFANIAHRQHSASHETLIAHLLNLAQDLSMRASHIIRCHHEQLGSQQSWPSD